MSTTHPGGDPHRAKREPRRRRTLAEQLTEAVEALGVEDVAHGIRQARRE